MPSVRRRVVGRAPPSTATTSVNAIPPALRGTCSTHSSASCVGWLLLLSCTSHVLYYLCSLSSSARSGTICRNWHLQVECHHGGETPSSLPACASLGRPCLHLLCPICLLTVRQRSAQSRASSPLTPLLGCLHFLPPLLLRDRLLHHGSCYAPSPRTSQPPTGH